MPRDGSQGVAGRLWLCRPTYLLLAQGVTSLSIPWRCQNNHTTRGCDADGRCCESPELQSEAP